MIDSMIVYLKKCYIKWKISTLIRIRYKWNLRKDNARFLIGEKQMAALI